MNNNLSVGCRFSSISEANPFINLAWYIDEYLVIQNFDVSRLNCLNSVLSLWNYYNKSNTQVFTRHSLHLKESSKLNFTFCNGYCVHIMYMLTNVYEYFLDGINRKLFKQNNCYWRISIEILSSSDDQHGKIETCYSEMSPSL